MRVGSYSLGKGQGRAGCVWGGGGGGTLSARGGVGRGGGGGGGGGGSYPRVNVWARDGARRGRETEESKSCAAESETETC